MNSIIGIPTMDNYYNNLKFNPILITVLVVVILLYFVLFGSLGESTNDSLSNDSNNGQLKFLGIILASIFVVLVLIIIFAMKK